MRAALKAIRSANMKIAKTHSDNPLVYKIDDDIMGGGVSVNALITTSHLTIHTAARHRIAEFDVATCGDDSDPRAALDVLEKEFGSESIEIRYHFGISEPDLRPRLLAPLLQSQS